MHFSRLIVSLQKILSDMSTNRTFQHRVTTTGIVIPIIMAVMAMYFLWHRTAIHLIIGFGLIVIVVLMLERLLHTRYTITADQLVIDRGRLDQQQSIPLQDITRITKIERKWPVTRYILIEYGGRHETAVQPLNEDCFIQEIQKRQDHNEDIQ